MFSIRQDRGSCQIQKLVTFGRESIVAFCHTFQLILFLCGKTDKKMSNQRGRITRQMTTHTNLKILKSAIFLEPSGQPDVTRTWRRREGS